jgi:predicted transcriptional regulator
MARRKTTVYLDEELLRATKVVAARTDRREYEIFEEALRDYLGITSIEAIRRRSDLTEDEAMELAVAEVHAVRSEGRTARAPSHGRVCAGSAPPRRPRRERPHVGTDPSPPVLTARAFLDLLESA